MLLLPPRCCYDDDDDGHVDRHCGTKYRKVGHGMWVVIIVPTSVLGPPARGGLLVHHTPRWRVYCHAI